MMSVTPAIIALVLLADTSLCAQDGWKPLWDGKTSEGWRSATREEFPASGWKMSDGVLTVEARDGREARGGGDIITRQRYANFELELEFRITPGANSGVKFLVQPDISPIGADGKPVGIGSAIGPEFQILDDERHPDALAGRNGNRKVGSLYDLIPAPTDKPRKPIGDWNLARILVRGPHVEFWLNGEKTVEFERTSAEFRQLVAESKYADIPQFGEWPDGHILLQDHGDEVSFRNIRIREFSASR